MKRLLCIVTNMNTGGAETFLMKIYRQLDRTKYQMDFCICNQNHNFYEDEIRRLGGVIYHLPQKTKHPFKYLQQFWKLLRLHPYTYVLRLGSTIFEIPDLYLAWLSGAKVRVFRSCNASANYPSYMLFLHKLLRRVLMAVVNIKIAPSDLAAQFTFGMLKNVCILPNGLNADFFKFSAENRKKIRQELNVQDKFVVGHVGRFNFQKNHKFLLQIFAEIKKLRPDAVLWLVGKGELENQIKDQVIQLHQQDNVQFLGIRTDIPTLLSGMDLLIFPSLFEGMPNTVIEAQTNGLSCLIADTITRQAKQTNLVHFVKLASTAKCWAEKAVEMANMSEIARRNLFASQMKIAGYEIKDVTKKFIQLVFENTKE